MKTNSNASFAHSSPEEETTPLANDMHNDADDYSLFILRAIRPILGVMLIILLFLIGSELNRQPAKEIHIGRSSALDSKPSKNVQIVDDHTSNDQGSPRKGPPSNLRIAWLMSFPNSGTSFTLKLVRSVSNMSTASNYCDPTGYYEPIYGPDYPGPHLIKASSGHPHNMPRQFILTKTHCGGRCNFCPPSQYWMNRKQFTAFCSTECIGLSRDKRVYRHKLVKRAVHLMRSPYDNIVSRFHLHMHHLEHRNNTVKLERYSYSPEGFQLYCQDLDSRFITEEQIQLSDEFMELAQDVPCHAEFLRYVRWHNLAFETTTHMDIPSHVLHYEDYGHDFNATLQGLLDFLHMPYVGEQVEFRSHGYNKYYTDFQKAAAVRLVRSVASKATLQQLERYGFTDEI